MGGAELSGAGFTGGRRAFQRTGVRDAGEDAGSGGGSFKSVGLRNIELTGPYFHNGGTATLEQLVDFYARGGDFANGAIRSFPVTPSQKAALVALERQRQDPAPSSICQPLPEVGEACNSHRHTDTSCTAS